MIMQTNFQKPDQKKLVKKGWSLDAKDVASSTSNDEVLPQKIFDDEIKNRLEINILVTTDQYQEVEIIYGNKKIRRRITKILPQNLANIVYSMVPSTSVGVLKTDNLSRGNHIFLQEKFMRILAKIYQISEIKTPEKIWDSKERLSTMEKAMLLATVNYLRPEKEKLDRIIISQSSCEISNQNSFKKFISEVVDMVKDQDKLAKVIFGDLFEKLSDDKKSRLTFCLKNILLEPEGHQMKFLQKVIGELFNDREAAQHL